MTKKVYTISELRALVTPVAQQHQVDTLYLFGSYARGEADENSDIDLRVDGGSFDSLFAWGALYAELENILQKKLDLVMTDALREKLQDPKAGNAIRVFVRNMKRDEVVLYAKSR